MKIYFASASANWSLVQDWIRGARYDGHEITFDWTTMIQEHGRGDPVQNDRAILKEAAHKDRAGVFDCEVFVLLWDDNMLGAIVETGMAIALGKRIWIVGKPTEIRYSIFWELPQVEQIEYEDLRKRLAYSE